MTITSTLVSTTTEMIISVAGAPVETQNESRRRLSVEPRQLTLRLTEGIVHTVLATGPTVRRDGSHGKNRSVLWGYGSRIWTPPPAWVQTIVERLGIPVQEGRP